MAPVMSLWVMSFTTILYHSSGHAALCSPSHLMLFNMMELLLPVQDSE